MSAGSTGSRDAQGQIHHHLAVVGVLVAVAAIALAAIAPALGGVGTQVSVEDGLAVDPAEPATAASGEGDDAASMVATSVISNPLQVELAVRPGQVRVGQAALARVTVHNLGDQALGDVEVELVAGAGFTARDGTTTVVGELPGGQRRTMRWRICGDASGNHVLVARARGTSTRLSTGYEAISGGQLVAVVEQGQIGRGRTHCEDLGERPA